MQRRNCHRLFVLAALGLLMSGLSQNELKAAAPAKEVLLRRLEEVVRSHVLKGFTQANIEAEVVAVHLPPNMPELDPSAEIRPQRTFLPTKGAGRYVVPVLVSRPHDRPVKLNPTVETVAVVHGWAARLPMKRGDLLDGDDFQRKTIRVTRREEIYFTEKFFPEGYQLSSSLAQGRLLQFHQIEEVPAVKPGETVMIYFRRNGITLISPGKVRRKGRIGDLVPVIAQVSGKRLWGRLEAPGIIVVE